MGPGHTNFYAESLASILEELPAGPAQSLRRG